MSEADFRDAGEGEKPSTVLVRFSRLVKNEVASFEQQNGALAAQLDTGRSCRHADHKFASGRVPLNAVPETIYQGCLCNTASAAGA